MLKEVVDFLLLIRSKFYPTCFGVWLPSSGGRECLIGYSSGVLCNGRMRIMTVRCGQLWNGIWNVLIKKSTTSSSICWSFYKRCYKMLGPTIKVKCIKLVVFIT
jgi:hypothetical protein